MANKTDAAPVDGFTTGARVEVKETAMSCMRGRPSAFRGFHGTVTWVNAGAVGVELDFFPSGLSFRRSQLTVNA